MNALDRLARKLLLEVGPVERQVAMARRTTLGIGGPADLLVEVQDATKLATAVRLAREFGQPVFVLGSGSNILVADAGIRGLVVDNRARRVELDGTTGLIRAESGASFASLARRACREGLAGLAWAVGIPGTAGGALVYNAGAYGGCLADVLVEAEILDPEGEPRWWSAEELGLTYRGSRLTRERVAGRAVLRLDLQLAPGDPEALLAEAATYDRRRLAAQPRGRSAGSMFKNPPRQPAWKLLERVGMRGLRVGDAAVSDRHCNFFLNRGNARASDMAELVAEAERRVYEEFGIRLQREVAFVGEWS